MSTLEIAFGPVPSRRLGKSLGVNHVPPKICTYSCVYCQVGRTLRLKVKREAFYKPEKILQAVRAQVEQVRAAGETIDYLTFVPDGEPTLDIHLGREIDLLKSLGLPVAVITNTSLIWQPDVRADLCKADWVSLKVDTATEAIWRRINRPHRALSLEAILDGALEFAAAFGGEMATETMLVAGVNDAPSAIEEVARFVARLQPATAYLAIPTRPPAEKWVRPPNEATLNHAFQIVTEYVSQVEYLIGYEGNAFAYTGNVVADLLAITAVHPMHKDAVDNLLTRAGADWTVIDALIAQGDLVTTEYGGRTFLLRRFRKQIPAHTEVTNQAVSEGG